LAHISETTGKYSQIIAKAGLIASGWEVAETETDESYDFVIRDPLSRAWLTAQCKTVRKRSDREGQLVVYAKNGKGDAYSPDDIDFIVGVLCENGETPRVFMFRNTGLKEYWRTEAGASRDWIEMSIALDRDLLLDGAVSESEEEPKIIEEGV